ncbi:hypothetical protein N7486_008495 [Penicillium sp. IBT 16267x]|nr:hypothetical protein N7486_008495 [Penicillium sp. IBT 16267x]
MSLEGKSSKSGDPKGGEPAPALSRVEQLTALTVRQNSASPIRIQDSRVLTALTFHPLNIHLQSELDPRCSPQRKRWSPRLSRKKFPGDPVPFEGPPWSHIIAVARTPGAFREGLDIA